MEHKQIGAIRSVLLKTKSSLKLSLGEYGRQRTSTKFHDLVLNLKIQNSRVLETIVFLALLSRRKVSVYSLRFKNRNHSYFFRKAAIKLGKKTICIHSRKSESSDLFVLRMYRSFLRIVSVFPRML